MKGSVEVHPSYSIGDTAGEKSILKTSVQIKIKSSTNKNQVQFGHGLNRDPTPPLNRSQRPTVHGASPHLIDLRIRLRSIDLRIRSIRYILF